jgi:hypothetical protein
LADLRTLQTAIEAYINEVNTPPNTLTALLNVSSSDRVVNEIPTDVFSPTDADYMYIVETTFNTTSLYAVHSVGADGLDDIELTELTDNNTLTTSEADDDPYVTNQRKE